MEQDIASTVDGKTIVVIVVLNIIEQNVNTDGEKILAAIAGPDIVYIIAINIIAATAAPDIANTDGINVIAEIVAPVYVNITVTKVAAVIVGQDIVRMEGKQFAVVNAGPDIVSTISRNIVVSHANPTNDPSSGEKPPLNDRRRPLLYFFKNETSTRVKSDAAKALSAW